MPCPESALTNDPSPQQHTQTPGLRRRASIRRILKTNDFPKKRRQRLLWLTNPIQRLSHVCLRSQRNVRRARFRRGFDCLHAPSSPRRLGAWQGSSCLSQHTLTPTPDPDTPHSMSFAHAIGVSQNACKDDSRRHPRSRCHSCMCSVISMYIFKEKRLENSYSNIQRFLARFSFCGGRHCVHERISPSC